MDSFDVALQVLQSEGLLGPHSHQRDGGGCGGVGRAFRVRDTILGTAVRPPAVRLVDVMVAAVSAVAFGVAIVGVMVVRILAESEAPVRSASV